MGGHQTSQRINNPETPKRQKQQVFPYESATSNEEATLNYHLIEWDQNIDCILQRVVQGRAYRNKAGENGHHWSKQDRDRTFQIYNVQGCKPIIVDKKNHHQCCLIIYICISSLCFFSKRQNGNLSNACYHSNSLTYVKWRPNGRCQELPEHYPGDPWVKRLWKSCEVEYTLAI